MKQLITGFGWAPKLSSFQQTCGVLDELLRGADFSGSALGHDYDQVVVKDSLESVGNGDHCDVSEVSPDLSLDEPVSHLV
jgi:hypothetical protein